MEYRVLSQNSEEVDRIDLPDEVFSYPVKKHLLWEVVRWQLASRRSGSASAKTRAEVRGSGRKLYSQKHTGRARAGDRKSPIRTGGGVAFPPKPRDFSYALPKKVRRAALKSALSLKVREGKLVVLDDIKLPEIKTKSFKAIVDALGLRKALFVIGGKDEVVEKSARNLPNVKVLRAEGLNVYDILRFEHLVMTKAALEKVEERLRI